MAAIFETLLLCALPASGKSETRTYLRTRNPEQFHMGETVQLDDYPYVHIQICIDEELEKLGRPRVYHHPDDEGRNGPFIDAYEWGALLTLVSEDYAEFLKGEAEMPEDPAGRLFERLDAASISAGGVAKITNQPPEILAELKNVLHKESLQLFEEKAANCQSVEGKTVVIEFARGGPADGGLPLPKGYGYEGSLPYLSKEVLNRAAMLYVWVTPEDSRRKNRERAIPGKEGDASILFHGTPESVMVQDYGCDDFNYLLEKAEKPGTITVKAHGEAFHLPVASFDNRGDLTTFLRKDEPDWTDEEVSKIEVELKSATDKLWEAYSKLHPELA